MRAISTVVAHFLHTEGVTGSNPVSPIFFDGIELFGVHQGLSELRKGLNFESELGRHTH